MDTTFPLIPAARRSRSRSVRASREERTRPLPRDELIPNPLASLTHAVTIRCHRDGVWPWLAQMGAGTRAGWYSYDALDNARQPSARRIIPELQQLSPGAIFPALPGATDAFTLLSFESQKFLVLGWVANDHRAPTVTWAFVLEDMSPAWTRLVVRVRAAGGYRFRGLPWWLTKRITPVVHFIMERRQLLAVAERVEQADPMLDRFMPTYDIVERHQVTINAPADVVFTSACDMNLRRSRIVRTIFRARELMLGALPDQHPFTGELLTDMQAIGWRVLAERFGREVVVGAVTRPWEASVTFRPLAPEEFASFSEPDYVKIVWTLRADPVDAHTAIFRTETRAVATDDTARRKFRRYWRLFSPRIKAIRRLMLAPLKAEAERLAEAARRNSSRPRDLLNM